MNLRRLATWLALLGMTLNALWPLLANAGPADFSAPVCSTAHQGASGLLAGTPLPMSPAKKIAPHCAFCGAGHSLAAMAPPEPGWFAAAVGEPPRQPPQSGSPTCQLLAANPRGPPVLSA